jgi:hypothetical protein
MCEIRLQCQGLPLEEPSFVGAGIERRGWSGGGERRGWRELKRREIQRAGAVREGGRRCLLLCSSAPDLSLKPMEGVRERGRHHPQRGGAVWLGDRVEDE